MNKKMILSAISILLVFATVFAFAGCDGNEDTTESTTIITAKNALPTDITTSYDESSNLITDTTYTPEQLQANTAKIFEYANQKMNALKNGVVAKVSMSQGKGIGDASEIVYLTQAEIKALVDEALKEYAGEVEGKLADADPAIADAKEAADKAAEKLEKAKAKGDAEKIKEAETSKKIADRLYQEAIAHKEDVIKGKKAIDEKLFDGSNFEVLSNEQYEIVNGYAQSKGITISFYPGNVVKAKQRNGVAMSENDYINTAIKSLDSYMLNNEGFSTGDEYVNVADYLPLAGGNTVWNLTLDDVKSATCVDMDGQRTITITLKGREFEDIIEQEIIESVYNVETIKDPDDSEMLKIEELIDAANDKVDAANEKIATAEKALIKAEKKKNAEAIEKAKADKAAAEAEKAAATAEKLAAEKQKRDALSLKSIDENVDDIMKEFEKANSYLTVEKPVLQYKDCQIIITMNLETEEIHTIQYKKSVDVSTVVTGQGSLAAKYDESGKEIVSGVGPTDVKFNYNNTITYNLERPEVKEPTTAA